MAVLFTQHWDVVPGRENEYSNFVSTKYNPTLERVGIHLVGGYYVAVGMGPRVIAVGVTQSLLELERALESDEYQSITNSLLRNVKHYHSKILVPTGRVEVGDYKIQTGIRKFVQYWNIIPGMEEEYTRFITEDYIPTFETLGVKVTGGWRVIVGSGPYIVAESSAASIVDIAKAIDTDEFRRIVRRLKATYVTDYHSRILSPTGRIDIPYFMQEMMKGF
ncbi:MAG: hypothetical protein HGA98_05865 [Deltaproteobacteria bacterium]|nr:hypothetical protein [Deltaproteobacteria bacterium]